MDIYKKLKELNFTLGEYVVVGGAMAAHGIRPANDLDVVVTEKLFKQLQRDGWEVCECEKCKTYRPRKIMKKESVDILSDYKLGSYQPKTEDLIKNADIINGYPFVKLEDLVRFKKELNREKDIKDIELIRKFLSKN